MSHGHSFLSKSDLFFCLFNINIYVSSLNVDFISSMKLTKHNKQLFLRSVVTFVTISWTEPSCEVWWKPSINSNGDYNVNAPANQEQCQHLFLWITRCFRRQFSRLLPFLCFPQLHNQYSRRTFFIFFHPLPVANEKKAQWDKYTKTLIK